MYAGFGFAAAYSPAPPLDFATAPAAPPLPQGACIPVPMDDTYAAMPLIADTSEIAAGHLVSSLLGSRFSLSPPGSRSCLLISFQFTVLCKEEKCTAAVSAHPQNLFVMSLSFFTVIFNKHIINAYTYIYMYEHLSI
jgi:hypothetical protein